MIAFLYCLVHLIETGRFLIDHFIPNEDFDDLVKLDIEMWQNNRSLIRTEIPRHIHQIWISSSEKKSMNEKYLLASKSCRTLNSNYNYTLWTNEKLLNLLKTEYPWFVSVYENYRYDMQRIDSMKYFLLFHYGGIYIDLDVKCLVNDLISKILYENEQKTNEPDIILHIGTEGISANTDFMISKRYHPFFKFAISRLKSANRWFYLYHLTIILSAGPTFLYGIYRKFPLKDQFYFIPNDFLWGKLIDGVGGGSWYGKDTLVLLFVMQHYLICSIFIFLLLFSFIFVRQMKKI
ncbi:unnamed protein product [Adineta ricciae]|uniref:Uncharacterized protein n=2 Tax=Adineta ricciae TaxID=249248 RepID=A0A814WV96_ADIRI|nr:unnamed protein product [Adineta ricciae]